VKQITNDNKTKYIYDFICRKSGARAVCGAARIAFDRSTMRSNPTWGIDVCHHFFCVCVVLCK
jgi:hypothetical protein